MPLSAYQVALCDRLRRLPTAKAPAPWHLVTAAAVGWLTEIGFAEGTDLLLVVSSQGRGVFDATTGLRIARDDEPPHDSWYDPIRLTAQGIGSIGDQRVRIAGLMGGGLPRRTRDGWGLERIAPDWPKESVVLSPPRQSVLIERLATGCARLDVDEIRAYGFSEAGNSFAVALASHTVVIWHRDQG